MSMRSCLTLVLTCNSKPCGQARKSAHGFGIGAQTVHAWIITSVNDDVCFIVIAIRAAPTHTNTQHGWQNYAYKEQVVVAACQRILRIQRLPYMNVGQFSFHLCLCTLRIFRKAFARKDGWQILGRILGPPAGHLIVTEKETSWRRARDNFIIIEVGGWATL